MQTMVPEREARVFREALIALNESATPYVVGGAFAVYHYSGQWRNTHDLDIYLEQKYVEAAVNALTRAGFLDLGEKGPGDRDWIYHAGKNRAMIDVIWQPPNHLSPVDESYYLRGRDGTLLGVPTRFLPPEELMWAKMFTLNHDRCDWPDIFSVVRSRPEGLDWRHLLRKMGDHWPVLLSFVVLYDWVYPGEAHCIPNSVRQELLKRKQQAPINSEAPIREAILDPWIYTRVAA